MLNPWDQTKRWINLNSKTYQLKISPHSCLIELFSSLGFQYTEDHIYLNLVSTPRLRSAYDKLIVFLQDKYGIEIKSNSNHFFDPFKAYKHSTTSNDENCDFELIAKDDIARQIHETCKKLNSNRTVTCLTKQDLCIKLIYPGQNSSRTYDDDGDSTTEGQNDQEVNDALLMIKNMHKNFQFQSKSKMKLNNLLKCKIYDKVTTVLMQSRIQFVISPVEILELTLPSSIKIRQIYQLLGVIKWLIKKLGCIYTGKLCIMPLKTELSQNSTLLDLDLVPNCRIHITGPCSNNRIDKDVLNNFTLINFTE